MKNLTGIILSIFSFILATFFVIPSHAHYDKAPITIAYVFVKDFRLKRHKEIYETHTKEQIVQYIHNAVVCGSANNVESSVIKQNQVFVTCQRSIWGKNLETALVADINKATIYDVRKRQFENNRTLIQLLSGSSKVIVLGLKTLVPELGRATGIGNLSSDPAEYQTEETPVTNTNTGETVKTKHLVGVKADMANLFDEKQSVQFYVSRSIQHEMGHSFGLFHTFQEGSRDDLITDTLVHDIDDCENYDIKRNIMSYCDLEFNDAFKYTMSPYRFTKEQRERMEAVTLRLP